MTKDYIAFPPSGCLAFGIGIGAKLHLRDRRVDRCNSTAKTRLACFAVCTMQLYANTPLANCTQLTWRHLYSENRTMCFDHFSIEELLASRHLAQRLDIYGPCWASCLFPCEYRQYDFSFDPEGCGDDNPKVPNNGVSLELTPRRFRVPIFEEHFSPTLTELFSRIGGTCGLWLGVGMLGICHALLFPLKLLLKLLVQRSWYANTVTEATK